MARRSTEELLQDAKRTLELRRWQAAAKADPSVAWLAATAKRVRKVADRVGSASLQSAADAMEGEARALADRALERIETPEAKY